VFPGAAEAPHGMKMAQFLIGCPGKDSQIDDTSTIVIDVYQNNCQEIGLSPS
jgi:hypothetical protein